MQAVRAETAARELFRDAAFPASDSSLFFNLSTPLAQFREDITWRRPQVQPGLSPRRVLRMSFPQTWALGLAGPAAHSGSSSRPFRKVLANPED